jgi:hypothetical protein
MAGVLTTHTPNIRVSGLHALCGLVPVATLEADGLEPRLVQTCQPAVLARDRRSRESSCSDWWDLARRRSLRGGGTNGRSAASEALIEVIHVHADGLTRGLKPSFTARPR